MFFFDKMFLLLSVKIVQNLGIVVRKGSKKIAFSVSPGQSILQPGFFFLEIFRNMFLVLTKLIFSCYLSPGEA